jgi:DNA polymerase III subunit gamma/tau
MSYVVLARKWRPRQFDELVGQEHVLRALANALDAGRVHHAFLFTGTRGVGKTTIARLLAKSLNCETGVSSRPCGKCSACREIDEGRFVDLLEVDAASRTKVDDTRELLDNVQYAPARGRYKVYLIDEVHMLSGHSFNALLKTLEEPPPHVKFLLATTDPQKLPVTVLSRCLQFNLKRLPAGLIRGRLEHIVKAEGMQFEAGALELVARAADGSMRDGLSLLDQLIAFAGGKLTEAEARSMLGTIDRGHTVRLLELLAANDAPGLLREVAAQEEFAPDYAAALDELAGLIQKVALRQAVRDYDAGELFSAEMLDGLASRLSAEDLQIYYQIAILGRRDLDLAPDPKGGFEMVLLRMLAFRPAQQAQLAGTAGATAAARTGTVASGEGRRSAPADLTAENWPAVVAALDVQGAARQLAANCGFVGRDDSQVHLQLDARGNHYRNRQNEDLLGQSLSRLLGSTVRVSIEEAGAPLETPARQQARASDERLQGARRDLESDPTVRGLKEKFGATLLPDSVKPLN